MVTSNPVVDISVDPREERRRRRRALLRVGIPLGGVALMIATILFIAFYADFIAFHADRANRDGALALSSDLLRPDFAKSHSIKKSRDTRARFLPERSRPHVQRRRG